MADDKNTKFNYLLNAMVHAGQEKYPAKAGYASKRKALIEHVRELERKAAAYDALHSPVLPTASPAQHCNECETQTICTDFPAQRECGRTVDAGPLLRELVEALDAIDQQSFTEENLNRITAARDAARAHVSGVHVPAAAEREACAKRIWDERNAERERVYGATKRTPAHQGDRTLGYLDGLERAHQLALSSAAPLAIGVPECRPDLTHCPRCNNNNDRCPDGAKGLGDAQQ